ncbi:MAG: GNAT family N-acetyltransferase, partial [Pseudomonadota bacterium]
MNELDTRRTRLREFSHADASELLAVFRNRGIRRFLLDDLVVGSEWIEEEIAGSIARFSRGSAGLWSVRLDRGGPIVGFVGYRDFFDPPELQLLYGLLPRCWGRGLATEVSARICEYGFDVLGFEEIRAAIDTPNHASRAVLERLGFSETQRGDGSNQGTAFFCLGRDDRAAEIKWLDGWVHTDPS